MTMSCGGDAAAGGAAVVAGERVAGRRVRVAGHLPGAIGARRRTGRRGASRPDARSGRRPRAAAPGWPTAVAARLPAAWTTPGSTFGQLLGGRRGGTVRCTRGQRLDRRRHDDERERRRRRAGHMTAAGRRGPRARRACRASLQLVMRQLAGAGDASRGRPPPAVSDDAEQAERQCRALRAGRPLERVHGLAHPLDRPGGRRPARASPDGR